MESHPRRLRIDIIHQAAVEAATTSLGRYMIDRKGEEIILRCAVLNKGGEWIWADILPDHWSITVARHPTEVGIFLVEKEVPRVSVKRPVDTFLRGGLHFTFWIDDGRSTRTQWSDIDLKPKANNSLPTSYIDRPESYAVSVDA